MADYLEKKYFHRYGFSEGGKEWGEMRFDWIPTVNEWRPYNEDDPLAEDDLELFIEEKEYELVNQMLDDENSRLHKFFINNPRVNFAIFFWFFKPDSIDKALCLILLWRISSSTSLSC